MNLIKVRADRMAELERKEQELADYYVASRLMRGMAVDMERKAQEGSQHAAGWIRGQQDWTAFLTKAVGMRSGT